MFDIPMLDTYVAQLILSARKIAYSIIDDKLSVIQTGGNAQLIAAIELANGYHLTDLIPELVGYEDQVNSLLNGTLPVIQLDLINRDNEQGETNYIGLTLYPFAHQDADNRALLLILEDVTQIGTTNQHLTQQHNELYLLHQQLHTSNLRLAAANAELQALDELKSRFVSIAAHELRTPIASLIGYVDFMLQDELEPLTQNQRSNLGIVERSGRRLLTITSDLLDITRLEAGRLELVLESVNLLALIHAVIAEFQPDIDAKELQLICHAEAEPATQEHEGKGTFPPVLCDEKRSIQIFSNLISNAIKYTPAGGQISILLSANQAESTATVRVIDTGIGIPADDLRQLGKAFFRASNVHKARTQGTGLGLHITHSLLELQGGTLHLDSTEGKGTTVSVTLPLDDGLFITPTHKIS